MIARSEARRFLLWLLPVWAVSRCALLWLSQHAQSLMPPNPEYVLGSGVWEVWARFDSTRYLQIATSGYFSAYLGPAGWFPGYPLLAGGLSGVLEPLQAAVLVSNLALLGALTLLYALLRLDTGAETARRAIVWLLAFPTAFIFSCVYSESTFLLFSCAALLAARHGRFRLAMLLASLTALTRLVGLVLLPVLWWEQRRVRPLQRDEPFWLLLPPLAVAGFFWHLQEAVGSFFAYFEIQKVYAVQLGVWQALGNREGLWLEHKVGLAFLLLEVVVLVLVWSQLRAPYRLYVVLSMLLTLSHSQGLCTQRFMLVLFPLFLGLATAVPRRVTWPLLALSLAGQAVFFLLWVQGYAATY